MAVCLLKIYPQKVLFLIKFLDSFGASLQADDNELDSHEFWDLTTYQDP